MKHHLAILHIIHKEGLPMKIRQLLLPALAAATVLGAHAAPVQWATNGHYYDVIKPPATWDDARAAALASTFNGMQGYLVTLTSEAEADFVYSLSQGNWTWTGGSDSAQEGDWRWMDGPEAGQVIGGANYARWHVGEPNDLGGEDGLHIWGTVPTWNDAALGVSMHYAIEYSPAVPEPESVALVLTGLAVVGAPRLLQRRQRPVAA